MTTTETKNRPVREIFYVIDGERGRKAQWIKVGAEFAHGDGKGSTLDIPLTLLLDGRGRLQTRERKADDKPDGEERA